MPDTASLEMPSSSAPSKGIPGWVMIAGAVAGIVGLVVLLKGQGGGGTTAAGTSINAALGSIQEENMNLLGVTQQGFMNMGQQNAALSEQMGTGFGWINEGMTQGFLNTQNSFGLLGIQVSEGFSQTHGLLGTLEHDIMEQIGAFSDKTQLNFNNMNSLIGSGQATQASFNAAQQSLLQSIQQDVASGLVGQQQANTMLNSIQGSQSGLAQLIGAMPNPAAFYFLTPAEQAPYLNVDRGNFQVAASHWANDAAAAVINFQRQNPQLMHNTYSYPGFTR